MVPHAKATSNAVETALKLWLARVLGFVDGAMIRAPEAFLGWRQAMLWRFTHTRS
jgi:hypothetical protein